jgi:hypothetical protein
MLADERLEGLAQVRPPGRVVAGFRLRTVVDRDAAAAQVLEIRLDDLGRVQRISPAVDDEERLVAQVVRKEIPSRADLGVAQDDDRAVEGKEGGRTRRCRRLTRRK